MIFCLQAVCLTCLFVVPPSFQNRTVNITAVPSLPLILPCLTFPDPTLSFTWLFNGVPLPPASQLVQEDGGLRIPNVLGNNEGVYTCIASNNLGSANGTVYLNVLGECSHAVFREGLALSLKGVPAYTSTCQAAVQYFCVLPFSGSCGKC